MADIITPKNGDVVSFQLVVNGVNGDERVQVKVLAGDISYQAALLMEPQVGLKHTALFPYFDQKVGYINDPSNYSYMAVQASNGAIEVIGLPWIQESSYRIVDGRIATLQITNFREDFRAPLKTFMANLGATYTLNVKDQ
jgi:hypothetical protein